jgi:hypothetical protein
MLPFQKDFVADLDAQVWLSVAPERVLSHTYNAEQVPCFQFIIRGKADPATLGSQALPPILFFLRWPLPQNLQR